MCTSRIQPHWISTTTFTIPFYPSFNFPRSIHSLSLSLSITYYSATTTHRTKCVQLKSQNCVRQKLFIKIINWINETHLCLSWMKVIDVYFTYIYACAYAFKRTWIHPTLGNILVWEQTKKCRPIQIELGTIAEHNIDILYQYFI